MHNLSSAPPPQRSRGAVKIPYAAVGADDGTGEVAEPLAMVGEDLPDVTEDIASGPMGTTGATTADQPAPEVLHQLDGHGEGPVLAVVA